MRKLLLLFLLSALLSGCAIASDNYRPLPGVRDVPDPDRYDIQYVR